MRILYRDKHKIIARSRCTANLFVHESGSWRRLRNSNPIGPRMLRIPDGLLSNR